MIKTTSFPRRATYLATASTISMLTFGAPCVAQAQTGTITTQTTPNPSTAANNGAQQIEAQRDNTDQAKDNSAGNDIVVTGSLLRRTSTETPSPVTVLTSDTLAKAGINNINDAVRSISADSAGSISTGFQNGFSAGGAAVSLRGLGVSSTLILIDGQRSANFPLNDDGHNAYVDLNSIPFSIVDRVEVLKDGASSSYGADAIGGVVNVILKKHFTGLAGQVEGGISSRGDAGQRRANVTAGYGDYDRQGFNIYVNGEYQAGDPISVQDRGFPYNTADLSSIGGLDNNSAHSSLSTSTINAVVRRTTQTNPNNPLTGGTAATTTGQYISLNLNCPNGTFTVAGAAGGTACRHDNTYEFAQILPKQERYSGSAKLSFKVADSIEGFVEGIYSYSNVLTRGAPRAVRSTQPFGGSPNLASSNPGIALPVYVCAAGNNCATAADARLDPYNPFAQSGSAARLYYLFGDLPVYGNRKNDLYRIAGGLNGTFGGGYDFRIQGVYAKDDFSIENHGYVSVPGVVAAISTGAYNFIDPSQNSQAVRNQVSPTVTTKSYTALASLDASISKSFVQLPGGELQVLVGGQVRRENLNNRSANPVSTFSIAGTSYTSPTFYGLNTAAAKGRHTVEAAYFEIDAPILTTLELNASGRYDHYSEGFSHFSPKIGVKFTPIPQFAVRGTYSQGFRAPTFAENGQSSYAGFSTFTPTANFQAVHGGVGTPDAYAQAYSLGTALVGNPNLKPETSRSFTAGVIIQPARWLSITADYYNIKKRNIIVAGPDANSAKAAYYAGTALPAGYTVNTIDAPDPLFPNALPRVLIINAPFVNAGEQNTSGIDVAATASFPVTPDLRLTSRIEVTDIFNFDLVNNGVTQKYVGTLGPYELSSGAGTPRVRANWQNTIEYKQMSLSATLYYVSRIKEVAADEVAPDASGNIDLSCKSNLYDATTGGGDNQFCYIRPYLQTNANASFRVNDKFTFYVDVINAFDVKAPIAPASYSGTNYLPTWHLDGVIGRQFRAGASFKF